MVDLTFQSFGEILKCDCENESHCGNKKCCWRAIVSFGPLLFKVAGFYKSGSKIVKSLRSTVEMKAHVQSLDLILSPSSVSSLFLDCYLLEMKW